MKPCFALMACWAVSCNLSAASQLPLAAGPEVQAALNHISADSLRGNLSFLASDALEGRNTPSRGLDIAAEFIASQFRRAGLEGPVDGGYFQRADFLRLTPATGELSGSIQSGDKTVALDASAAVRTRGVSAVDLNLAPIYKISGNTVPEDIAGKVALLRAHGSSAFIRSLREKKPALILTVGRRRSGAPSPQLVAADDLDAEAVPVIAVRGDSAASKLLDSLPDGATAARLTVHAPAPQQSAVQLRNVIGVLPGSDPQLKNSYILVTAHYDHLGMKTDGDGDRIYNGANDDGSGTVSLIEIAGALASLHPHTRRSIVFLALFGEEEGLYGSKYYSRHPVFPLEQTEADINIEQVGRTDDSEGPQIASATMTGFTYSDLPALFTDAGKSTGVKVRDRNPGDDPFFARSDNQPFADIGIPAHTIAVALEFPDYHGVGDEWQKIDYTNMTTIDRMLALGIISLADDSESPEWNESNENNRNYLAAWRKLHPSRKN